MAKGVERPVVGTAVRRPVDQLLCHSQRSRRPAADYLHGGVVTLIGVEEPEHRASMTPTVRAGHGHAARPGAILRGSQVLRRLLLAFERATTKVGHVVHQLGRRRIHRNLVQAHHVRGGEALRALQVKAQAGLAIVVLHPGGALRTTGAEPLRLAAGDQLGDGIMPKRAVRPHQRQFRAALLMQGR
ncbi:hypothetical protein [Roseateles sp. YR242]|uniref:hypothetical protein n=1 Tax=Roseateles sp. YR242 TaxID=1855305 RepID=UPI00116020A6|nr:hypothetical protein [Roseateles sp. YR242]